MLENKAPERMIIGSRESALAVVQAKTVQAYLMKTFPEKEFPILTMKTTGDKILDRTLDKIGGKGLFVKELDRALASGQTDLSVHSLKDVPMEVDPALPMVGFSAREDARDVLVLPKGVTEPDLSKPIGTSSLRRILQLKKCFPGATFAPVRGNLQTRLRKLDEGNYSALVLAAAGMKRMGLEERISRYFETEEILPAAGQAILALQGREGTDYSCMEGFRDQQAEYAALAERAYVRELDGGCTSPIAAHAVMEGNVLTIKGLYWTEDMGEEYRLGTVSGKVDSPEDCEKLGRKLAGKLREIR